MEDVSVLLSPAKPAERFLCSSAPPFLPGLLHPFLFQLPEARSDEEQRPIAGKALLHVLGWLLMLSAGSCTSWEEWLVWLPAAVEVSPKHWVDTAWWLR